MQQRAGRKLFAQPPDERAGEDPLLRGHGGEVPLRGVRFVHRNKRRLAAHRKAHVVFVEIVVDGVAQHFNASPLFVRVRLGDAR